MRIGMGILAAACVVLGLGATWFLPVFDPDHPADPGRARQLRRWLPRTASRFQAGTARSGTVSTAGIAAMLFLALGGTAAFSGSSGACGARARRPGRPGIAVCPG